MGTVALSAQVYTGTMSYLLMCLHRYLSAYMPTSNVVKARFAAVVRYNHAEAVRPDRMCEHGRMAHGNSDRGRGWAGLESPRTKQCTYSKEL